MIKLIPEGFPENQQAFSVAEKQKLRKAGYFFVGKHHHASVKTCLYAKKAILDQGWCYKNSFYGIQSHRCLQMTPSTPFCTLLCTFCWRPNAVFEQKWVGGVDDAKTIVDESILAQQKLLNGLPGFSKTNKTRWLEAQKPLHAAISLAGEPALYAQLPTLIKEFHSRGMTTFLVTNGTQPSVLEDLLTQQAMPTQLYVSLSAFDEQNYRKTNVPLIKDYWRKYLQSLDFMKKVKNEHRTVLRMTLVKNWNFSNPEKYSELIEKALPTFVEVKSFMAIGGARERIGVEGMAEMNEIRDFAKQLAQETGYVYSIEHQPSRVVLLCRDKKAEKNRLLDLDSAQNSKQVP